MPSKKPPFFHILRNTMSRKTLHIVWWVLGTVLVAAFAYLTYAERKAPREIAVSYTQLLRDVKEGKVLAAQVQGASVRAAYRTGEVGLTANPGDPNFVPALISAGVDVSAKVDAEDSSWFGSGGSMFLMAFGPTLLLIGVMFYIFRKQSGAAVGRSGAAGMTTAQAVNVGDTKISFKDVAGCDEAKEEVAELVDFLRDPGRFQKLGGRIPRGVLLAGPPGTGKTLLAKAIAGEAQVPFLSMSGSGFVEMFVGVGAARVRDLFSRAKSLGPCIVFIDEIDAVGRSRGMGMGGGNDEREQTLNQLLVEMDGFDTNLGIIVIAATNRPDILDKALTRPGRFDRQVFVSLPDIRGREQILHVHMRKIPVAATVDALALARGTPGFSGADLGNLVNEAALFAARRRAVLVEPCDFEAAKDKVLMGPERKSMVMPDDERRNTAYHEAGHAIVARLLPKTDPVHKVTILPRGRALGLTMQLPEDDRYSTDRVRLESTIAVLFGGRVAEELFMHQATTGASNDFERATAIARNMVTRWGYSDVLGPMVLAGNETEPSAAQFLAPETLREVDQEIRGLLKKQYARAIELLRQNEDKVHVMANALLDWETLDADQVGDIMEGRTPRAPKPGSRPTYEVATALSDAPATQLTGLAPAH